MLVRLQGRVKIPIGSDPPTLQRVGDKPASPPALKLRRIGICEIQMPTVNPQSRVKSGWKKAAIF